MSNAHTYLDAFDRPEPAFARLRPAAIEPLRIAVAKRTADLIARFQNHRTMRRIEGFSGRRLRDIGFERDWDGSILPRQQ